MQTQHFIKLNNQNYPFWLSLNSKAKAITLRINGGQIYISAPPTVSLSLVKSFILKQQKRIMLHLNDFQQNKKLLLASDNPHNNKVVILEHSYPIAIEPYSKHYAFSNGCFYIPSVEPIAQAEKLFYHFLIKKYASYFDHLTKISCQRMQLPQVKVVLKVLKSKWGICYYKRKQINLNIKLLHFNEQVVEYAIVHELAHFFHQNHSHLFWTKVKAYIPDYKQLIKILKTPGV